MLMEFQNYETNNDVESIAMEEESIGSSKTYKKNLFRKPIKQNLSQNVELNSNN